MTSRDDLALEGDDPTAVFVADEQSDVRVQAERWARLARLVLHEENIREDAELSLLFVDEATISQLNERFLARTGPTDVLAFPMEDDIAEAGRRPDQGGRGPGASGESVEPPLLVGDVVICPLVAQRQAPDHAGPRHAGTVEDEIAVLVVHGVLHVLGFDHEDDEDARVMASREQELLDLFRSSGEG